MEVTNFTIFILASLACAEFITELEFSLTISSPSLLLSHFSEWTTPTHLFECLSPLLLHGCNKTKSKGILWPTAQNYQPDCDQLHKITFYDIFKHIALIFVFSEATTDMFIKNSNISLYVRLEILQNYHECSPTKEIFAWHTERQQYRQSQSQSDLVEQNVLSQNWKTNMHMWEFRADTHMVTHPHSHPPARAHHSQEHKVHPLAEAAAHSHQADIKETWKTVCLQIRIWSQTYFEFL